MKKVTIQELDIEKGYSWKSTRNMLYDPESTEQPRAKENFIDGLELKARNYNIFVSGDTGTGRRTFVQKWIAQFGKNENTPTDWIYVFNFEDISAPLAIELPAGIGKNLKKDWERMIEELLKSLESLFESDTYNHTISEIDEEFEKEKSKLWNHVYQSSQQLHFMLQNTPTGIVHIPVKENKPITTEARNAFSKEEKLQYEGNSVKVRYLIEGYLFRSRQIEKEFQKKYEELNRFSARFAIHSIIQEFEDRYQQSEVFLGYVQQVVNDLLDQLPLLLEEPEHAVELLKKYRINLFVDQTRTKGAPMRFVMNPSYATLFGKIEYLSNNGNLYTDHTLIKPGAIHECNGGYLVLDARDIVSNCFLWDTLKKYLYSEKIGVENEDLQYGFSPMATLKPQPIPLLFKCILIGEPDLYDELHELDADFEKLFYFKVEFDDEIEDSDENRNRYTQFIANVIHSKKLLPLHETGTAEVFRYSMLLADSRNKLSAQYSKIIDLLIESDQKGRRKSLKEIDGETIQEVLQRKKERSNLENDKIDEMIRKQIIHIHTCGKQIGQVNALTVVDLPDSPFGTPTRVTATYALGSGNIVDIHREIDMSGKIFKKAILTLESYIESTFSQKFPLSIKGTLAFEQTYASIEGDSATMAETVALLSVLAKVPIDQGIAITGSMSQLGEAQAVGGINDKIQGFFHICKMRGLTGYQGVIIPSANKDSFVPDIDVLRAIQANRFHIWCVDTLEEVVELVMKMPVGKRSRGGNYPKGTLYARVMNNLYKAYRLSCQGEEIFKSSRREKGKSAVNQEESETE